MFAPDVPEDREGAPACGDHLEGQGQQRQGKQDVDKSPHHEAGDQAQEPENQKDDE